MTWPSSDVDTTDTDSASDNPANARADILDLMQKFNQLRAHVTAFMQGVLDDADAAAARNSLGLGSLATLNSVATGNVDNDAITYAKLQNLTTARMLGRTTGGTGDCEEISVGTGLTLSALSLAASAALQAWHGKTAPSGTVVGTSDSQTLTNKTLTSPAINTATYDGRSTPSVINSGTQQTLSGSSVTFSSIPAGVKRITIMISGMNFASGTGNVVLTLGDSGGLETTGYAATCSGVTATADTQSTTAGFQMILDYTASQSFSGSIILSLQNSTSNRWVAQGIISSHVDILVSYFISGTKDLSATLDRLQIAAQDNFDAGTINISWEF